MSETKEEAYPILQGGEPPAVMSGELLNINGAPFRVTFRDRTSGEIRLEPAGESKLPKPPIRVGQIKKDEAWRPCIMNANGVVIAVLYGPDRASAEEWARKMAASLDF